MKRNDLVTYIDSFLDADGVADYCPNGLQVEGADEIEHVVCGVTACLELIEAAARKNAQAVLVHHGILWGGNMPVITRSFRKRIKALLDADLNLLAYHLPLDRHLEVGNGACVAHRIGLEDITPFGAHRGITVGVRGRLSQPVSVDRFCEQLTAALGVDRPIVFPYGCDAVETVGIVTGAADKDLPQAVEAGLDCYVTGEVSEYVMHYAREEGIHFIAAGHHATERWGVQSLAAHLSGRFDLTWEFVDIPNPA